MVLVSRRKCTNTKKVLRGLDMRKAKRKAFLYIKKTNLYISEQAQRASLCSSLLSLCSPSTLFFAVYERGHIPNIALWPCDNIPNIPARPKYNILRVSECYRMVARQYSEYCIHNGYIKYAICMHIQFLHANVHNCHTEIRGEVFLDLLRGR